MVDRHMGAAIERVEPLPIVRNADDGVRELVKFQWGMPTPPERVKSKADYETTNIRIAAMDGG
jgi:putative SOS response-associated peptidase YedK